MNSYLVHGKFWDTLLSHLYKPRKGSFVPFTQMKICFLGNFLSKHTFLSGQLNIMHTHNQFNIYKTILYFIIKTIDIVNHTYNKIMGDFVPG